MKCRNCKYCMFKEDKSGVNRYYCKHPLACKDFNCGGGVIICRTVRHETDLKIKTAPRWCPENKNMKG